jgi:hypothetical protein
MTTARVLQCNDLGPAHLPHRLGLLSGLTGLTGSASSSAPSSARARQCPGAGVVRLVRQDQAVDLDTPHRAMMAQSPTPASPARMGSQPPGCQSPLWTAQRP